MSLRQIKEAVEKFECGELQPDEKRALCRAVNAFYPDGAVDEAELRALRQRFQAVLRVMQKANAGRQLQPKPSAEPCRIYEETPITNGEVVAGFKRELLAERHRIRRPTRKRGTSRPGRRVRGRSRCRRDSKRRSSARSGDGPDGELSPGLGERLLFAQLARQQDHIDDLGEVLDEAIEALAEMRAELDRRDGR